MAVSGSGADRPLHLALLIPDGPGVRNLQLTRFPRLCAERGLRVTAFTVAAGGERGGDDDESLHASASGPGVWRDRPLVPHPEGPAIQLLRYALYYGHLAWGDTRAMQLVYRQPITGSARHRLLRGCAKALGRLCAGRRRLDCLERPYRSLVARAPATLAYEQVFGHDPPDFVLASHQRPPSTAPPVIAARRLGIPTGSQIFSWDNLTSKGRIASPFESYMVWSELMESELRRFYPRIGPDDVHLVGAAQFDPYADDELLQRRDEFLAGLGLDPARPVICFSGGDRMTCPEDPEHLELLLELIADGRVPGRPQVIARPSPVDDGARYERVRGRFPELVFSPPLWSTGNGWHEFIPTAEDVRLLANLTQHCDLNVNTASTMSLDFAIHDRPVVNLAIDMHDPPVYGGPLREVYYRFEHYQRVVESGAVRVATSADELAAQVAAYLADPTLDRAERAALVRLQVGRPIGTACSALLDACVSIASRHRAGRAGGAVG